MHKSTLLKYLKAILAVQILTISYDLFLAPTNLDTGGTGGIAIIVKQLTGLSTSTFIAMFYFAMIVLNFFVFGKKSTKDLLFFSVLYPLSIKLYENIPNIINLDYESNKLVIYLFAAILSGIGNGIIYKNGFLSGGTDVIKKILSDKMHIQMGIAGLIVDGIIVLSGGFLFGLNSVIYAIIVVYIVSNISDRIILGISRKKMFYIMTDNDEDIRNCIKNEFKHGITEIDAVGGFNKRRHILMTVIDTSEYIKLKEKINEIDNKAFMIITDSYHYYHGR